MFSKLPSPPQDQVDTDALRDTLRRHAPTLVDADVAWAAISKRLMLQSARPLAPARPPHAYQSWARRLRLPRVAAVLAFAVLLMGAGAAGGHYLWGWPFGSSKAWVIGDERLYTQINQTQTADGVTITLIEGYADPGNTYLAYSIQMSPTLRRQYTNITIGSWDLTDQSGTEPAPGANIFCQAAPSDGGPQYCLIDEGPFAPQQGVTQLALTLGVTRVYVFGSDGRQAMLAGPWRFQFTLPWHTQNLGPGGPYAQPTSSISH